MRSAALRWRRTLTYANAATANRTVTAIQTIMHSLQRHGVAMDVPPADPCESVHQWCPLLRREPQIWSCVARIGGTNRGTALRRSAVRSESREDFGGTGASAGNQ